MSYKYSIIANIIYAIAYNDSFIDLVCIYVLPNLKFLCIKKIYNRDFD